MGKAGQGNRKWCCEAVSLWHPVALICSQVVTEGHHHLLALCGISVLASKCISKIIPKQLGLFPVLPCMCHSCCPPLTAQGARIRQLQDTDELRLLS